MNNFVNILRRIIRHNTGLAVSAIIALVMIFWFYGCESQTQSLIVPTRKVTETQLEIEYSSELGRLEAEMAVLKRDTELRLQDLHRQDKFKQALFEQAKLFAVTGNPNPLGILYAVGAIMGIGTGVNAGIKKVKDNKKKPTSGI